MQRVLSAIQPTGDLHLGNYFGAIKNWVEMQDQGDLETIYGVVNLHAITTHYDPNLLKERTIQMYIDLMACGIDTDKSILFVQSQVPEHTELSWIFKCITPYGELTRQTQFKDKSSRQNESGKEDFISTGLLAYPVLQAADILVYNADFVPVGQDQKQHLELTRNIAIRFNGRFGDYFKVPEHKFTAFPKVMSLADPSSKMSKSLGEKHYLGMFDDEKKFRKKINKAVTDSGEEKEGMSVGVKNLLSLIKACGNAALVEQFENEFNSGELMYGKLKGAVADELLGHLEGIRKKREELMKNKDDFHQIIKQESAKAREIAAKTLSDVRELTGL